MDVKLTTYAYPYILGEMRKLVREDKTLKVSRDISKLYNQIEKVRNLLYQKNNKEASITEISEVLNIPEFYIVEAIKSKDVPQSMDEIIFTDSKDISLSDKIENKKNIDIEKLLILKEQLNKLSELDRNIIISRYFEDYTQNETAKKYNMSQVQISRQEKKILKKIKSNIA